MAKSKHAIPRERTIRLCCATMIGPDPEDVAAYAEAAASVEGLVDGFVKTHPGRIDDFSAARNDLLRKATQEGFTHALLVDCDERVVCADPEALRAILRETRAALLVAHDSQGVNTKDRIVRLPMRGQFEGTVHEAFALRQGATGVVLPGDLLSFWELPKSEEQTARRISHYGPLLEEAAARDPDNPRTAYLLGNFRALAGDIEGACDAWATCYALDGRDDRAAQAAYRIGTTHFSAGLHEEALSWCSLGMQRHSGLAELPILAGMSAYALGQPHQALRWLRIAKALGFRDPEAAGESVFQRVLWATWEMPFALTGNILREVGADAARIAREDRDYEAACAARLAIYPQSPTCPGPGAQFTT